MKIVFTYTVTTLYRTVILRSTNTLKYSYKQAQYNVNAIRLNKLQTSQHMTEK